MATYKHNKYLPKRKTNTVGWVMAISTAVFLGVATTLIILAYQNKILGWFKTFGMVLLAIGMVLGVYVIHWWVQSKIKEM